MRRDDADANVSSHILLFVNRFLLAALSDSRVRQTKGRWGKQPSRKKLLLPAPRFGVYGKRRSSCWDEAENVGQAAAVSKFHYICSQLIVNLKSSDTLVVWSTQLGHGFQKSRSQ